MRNFIMILCFILASYSSFGQSEQLESLVDGMLLTIPDLFTYHPYPTKIEVIDILTKNEFEKSVVILTDKKCFGTILGIKMNDNLAYVAGYAPIIKNNRFTGEGEFILYKKENAENILLKKVIKEFTKKVDNNQIFNEIEGQDFAVQIKNWEEVYFMIFQGYAYVLPNGYFKF